MYPRVTAIVVARNGGAHLRRTLDALRAQTRQPDAVIAIDCASTDDTASILAEFGPTQIVSVREKLSFGIAVATAARVTTPPESEHELLWLLAQDTAPEPGALDALVAAVEVSPSVAAAGPKQVDWDDASLIREFGEAVTPFGASVSLVENELDQAQHDGLSDVLGVAPGGLIVRHTVWEKLGGFDFALTSVDDGLDFCVRVRLAGYRVVLVPSARVATAGDGVAGPSRSAKSGARRRRERERRTAQLHRRMVYAHAALVPLHWLTLVPLAFLRSIGRLIGKQPGAIAGEFAAAFRTAFAGIRVGAARRALARNRTVGWVAIDPLRVPLAEVRRARALKKEAAFVHERGERRDLNFLGGGGAWTVLGVAVLGLALFARLLGTSALAGGSLLPLSNTVAGLWQNVGYGWRDIGLGFVGAADPFSSVLAVLGSLTFWQPSFSLVLVYFVALPLAALGAWLCASRLTERPGLRAFAALAWAIAPMLLEAMQSGRLAPTLAHVLLPWVFYAGFLASRSWAASATTSLLAAATIACAPSLAPALAVVWVIAIAVSGRRAPRLIVIPLPTLALFAPLIWMQGARGAWLSLVADPGVAQLTTPGHPWQLALGFSGGSLGGWQSIATSIGLPGTASMVLVPVLLAPIAILAILALFLRGSVRAMLALVVALLGFATAVAAAQISVTLDGSAVVGVWPGSGLSLYWLGLVGAATLGLSALGRFATAPAWIALIALAVAVTPVAIAMPLGTSIVSASDGQTLPAVVTADAASHPRVGTLLLSPEPDGAISAELIRGAGVTLDDQSTLSSTARFSTPGQRQLATLAGNLASRSGYDATTALSTLGIGFVMLADTQTPTTAAQATDARALSALDGNALLTPIGATSGGTLWSYAGSAAPPPLARIPVNAGAPISIGVLIGQGVIIAVMLLLAIPGGRSTRRMVPVVNDRPSGRRRRKAAQTDDELAPEPDEQDAPDDEPAESEPRGDDELVGVAAGPASADQQNAGGEDA